MERPHITVLNRIRHIYVWIVLLLCTVSLLRLSGYGITQINLGAGFLYAFLVLNYRYYCKNTEYSYRTVAIIASVIGSLSLSCGSIIRDMDQSGLGRSLQLTDFAYAVGIFIALYFIIHNVLFVLDGVKVRGIVTHDLDRKWCVVLILFFLFAWSPYYLTFFPGIFGSDPLESIRMGNEGFPWTNHHPVLYTFFIKMFLLIFQKRLGINGALGLMILVQQGILASVFSIMIRFMWKRGINIQLLLFTVVFIAFNPVIAIFSVYATKDILFSASILVLMLKLYKLQESAKQSLQVKFWIELGINAFFVIFLRNNGLFIIVGVCIYLLLRYKIYWKQIEAMLILLLLCVAFQKQVLFPMLSVEEGSFAESLSIPLQQVGQAVVDGARLTEEEEIFLEQILPMERMKEVYEAGYTDPIKFDEEFNDAFLNDNKVEFMKVWFGMLPNNFSSYLKAYLLQTAGYWDVSQTESLTIYGVTENELGIEQQDVIKSVIGFSLQPLMEKMILVCRKLPVLCYLTNMALMLFYTMFAGYLFLKKGNNCVCLVPLWTGWMTIMIAAPASCKFRYMLPMYMAIPIVLWLTMTLGMNHEEE